MNEVVETPLGFLPKNWEVVELEEKAESFQYGTSVKCSYERDGKPVLRIPNVVGGAVDVSDLKFGNPKPNELDKLVLKAGDLLFVRTNGVKENAGRCSRFEDELADCYYASYLIRVRLNPETLDPRFLGDYTRTEFGTSFLSGRAVRTADGKFNINSGTLKTMIVPVPPIDEQKQIAHVLSTVQRAIEAQERIIQTTTELKKALMHKLFTEGLRNEPQKQTEIGPVPKSWEVDRFDSFCALQRGFDITKKQQRPGDYPVVSSGGVSSYHDEAKVKGPGVVIGRKGSLGTVHFITSDYWPHDTTLWVKDFKGNDPRFVGYLLETLELKRFDTGAANPTLNRNIVHAEKIAFPPEDQQVEIGDALAALESKIEVHRNMQRSYRDLFRTFLHELMTAKTRVHELKLSS